VRADDRATGARPAVTAPIMPDDDAGLAAAIEVLRSGGIVALPTDTVYGIAVDLDTAGGIERLFAAKRRPPDKAIGVLVDGLDQVSGLVELSPAAGVLVGGRLARWPDRWCCAPARVHLPWPLTAANTYPGCPRAGSSRPAPARPCARPAADHVANLSGCTGRPGCRRGGRGSR